MGHSALLRYNRSLVEKNNAIAVKRVLKSNDIRVCVLRIYLTFFFFSISNASSAFLVCYRESGERTLKYLVTCSF